MNKLLAISLLSVIAAPATGAYAFVNVEDVIDAARAGNGTVVESHSSVSTGGQTAASGESVTTGDVSASSHVETRINAGSEGGTVQVKVQTSKNGETETKTYTEKIEPGDPVHVNASVSATNDGAETSVSANGEESTSTSESGGGFFAAIPTFFFKILSFFSWF